MKRAAPLGAIFIAAIMAAVIGTPSRAEAKETVMVPMRDGVKLATEIYLPAGEGPWPTILVMTPYGRKGRGGDWRARSANGAMPWSPRISAAGATPRARTIPVFASCGWGEHQDGYDTVEWIAKQRWSNGKVGGWGISAPASP